MKVNFRLIVVFAVAIELAIWAFGMYFYITKEGLVKGFKGDFIFLTAFGVFGICSIYLHVKKSRQGNLYRSQRDNLLDADVISEPDEEGPKPPPLILRAGNLLFGFYNLGFTILTFSEIVQLFNNPPSQVNSTLPFFILGGTFVLSTTICIFIIIGGLVRHIKYG